MKVCPSQVNELIQSGTRTFSAKLLKPDGTAITKTEIISGQSVTSNAQILEFKKNCASNADSSDFSIGSTISQYIEITMEKPTNYDVEDKELRLVLSLLLDESTQDYYDFNLGYFTVTKPKTDEETITFTAFDRMLKLETLFSSELPDTTTTDNVLSRITAITGVSVNKAESTGYTNLTISKPTALSCREVLSYIAQFYGGFAIINNEGQIVIKRYTNANVTITPDIYWETFQHNDFVYELAGISCTVGTNENNEPIVYTQGSTGPGTTHINFSNPFMTDTDVARVWSYLENFSYMPGTVEILGDPRLDVWDIITIVDLNNISYNVPVMSMQHEFDGGLTTTITAVGKSESDNAINYTGPTTKAMDRYYAQLVTIDKALIGKLDASEASITYATINALNAETATITGNLDAAVARIVTLEGDTARFNQLIADEVYATNADFDTLTTDLFDASTGRITVLDSEYANIATILSGNVGTGQLQTITLNAQNATIDAASINLATLRNLLAQYITVGDLLAGRISTNDFTVGSDDGAFNIAGATLAIKDGEGNTRIQIGKDGQGNFTFTLFDEDGQGILINETGVQDADAIADGLISNVHVANNAAIAGTKLDIASVFEAMNGSSSTLNATHIYLDEGSQTLTQAYSQLSTNITNVSSVAQTANDNANRAMRAIEGISSLDNLTAILSNDAHVVHTLTDGSSGDYTNAITSVYAYRGDTDVTDYSVVIVNPSSSVTGTWNNTTKTYQVTALSEDDGYVDFDVSYGSSSSYVHMPDDDRLVMPGNKPLVIPIAAHVYKRFSISKSRDGRVGTSYKIQSSIGIIRRNRDGTLNPSTVTFSAKYSDGSGLFNYSGKYIIAESQDGNTWTTAYESSNVEASKTFTPTSGTRFIRATLLNEEDVQLDIQTITIIADADELATDLQAAETAIVSVTERVGTVETGINGLSVNLQEMETQIQGVGDRNLVYTTPYTIDGDDVTFTARVYKNGTLVTTEYPESWFSWLRRTEDGDEFLGTGYTLSTQKSLMGIGGGVIIGRFETFDDSALVLPDNKYLIMPDENRLTLYTAS